MWLRNVALPFFHPVSHPLDSQPFCCSFILLYYTYTSLEKTSKHVGNHIKPCSCSSHTLRKHQTHNDGTNRPHRCFVLYLCTERAHHWTKELEAALSLAASLWSPNPISYFQIDGFLLHILLVHEFFFFPCWILLPLLQIDERKSCSITFFILFVKIDPWWPCRMTTHCFS